MPEITSGLVSAITGVLLGLIIELSLQGFVSAGILGPSMVAVYQLLNVIAIFAFVHITRYWGILYLFGWWSGSGIVLYTGLLGSLEFTLYSIILVLVLISRIRRRFG